MAKQGWRLLTSPDIITSWVIKAKYYPHSSIFEANVGKKPSFAWRNINGELNIVKRLCWRIGNGQSLNTGGQMDSKAFHIHGPLFPQVSNK